MAAKYRKLHAQVKKTSKRLPSKGTAEDLDRLEALYRGIEKYLEKKLWVRLKKLTPPVDGLSPAELNGILKQLDGLL